MVVSGELVVFGETSLGSLEGSAYELLGRGAELARELSCSLSAVIVGHDLERAAVEVSVHGAERVYVIEHEGLAHYSQSPYLAVLEEFWAAIEPRWLLFPHTALARDLAPRLALQKDAGLASGCLSVRVDAGAQRLVYGRPVYGGKGVVEFGLRVGRPQVATVLPRSYQRAPEDSRRRGEIISLPGLASGLPEPAVRVVSEEPLSPDGSGLADAEVVVAGGAGLGGSAGFRALEELAGVLGGVVGASKKAVDLGWVSPERQIGISGATVAPGLYIAIGISGASQHLLGCNKSQKIVAINRDAEAAIFRQADYGLVGEWQEILPAVLASCQRLLGIGVAERARSSNGE